MNIVFFIGKEIEQGIFKFIIDRRIKHKSQYSFKFELLDGNIVNMIAYDEVADYIVQNKPENLLIQGNLKIVDEQIQVEINSINGVQSNLQKYVFL